VTLKSNKCQITHTEHPKLKFIREDIRKFKHICLPRIRDCNTAHPPHFCLEQRSTPELFVVLFINRTMTQWNARTDRKGRVVAFNTNCLITGRNEKIASHTTIPIPFSSPSSFTIARHWPRSWDFRLHLGVSVRLQSLKASQQLRLIYGVELSTLLWTPPPGGPGYPFLSESSPLTSPAWQTLSVAKLPTA
jgi:hypothetical protein